MYTFDIPRQVNAAAAVMVALHILDFIEAYAELESTIRQGFKRLTITKKGEEIESYYYR